MYNKLLSSQYTGDYKVKPQPQRYILQMLTRVGKH